MSTDVPRGAGVLACALVCLALSGEPASGEDQDPQREREALLQKASDTFRRDKNPNGALALYNQAVERYPEDLGVRLQRGIFFEQVAKMVKQEERNKFLDYSRQDYAWVAEKDPDSTAGGVGRDGMRRILGTNLFPERSAPCPVEANEAWHRGESEFLGGRYREALNHYSAATTACPASAPMWVAHADAYYQLGEYDQARDLFAKAITADPWNRAARRLMADTEVKRNDLEAALRSAAWAVIADPQSEAAWSSFRQLAEGTGRIWHRVYEEKPAVGGGDKPGDIQITLPFLGTSDEDKKAEATQEKKVRKTREQRRQEKAEQKANDAAESAKMGNWIMYAMTKSLALTKGADGKAATPASTPLEIERAALEGVFISLSETGNSSPPFWKMMLRAKQANYLDEAIYFHLMDAELAPQYREFRDAHADRLLAYLTTILAEPPAERTPKDEGATKETG